MGEADKTTTRKRSRPNAWRSCRACKERKQRCELPEHSLLLDPSHVELDEQHACTRCHLMATPCVLDDYEKEARIAMERRKRSRREMNGMNNARNTPAVQGESGPSPSIERSMPLTTIDKASTGGSSTIIGTADECTPHNPTSSTSARTDSSNTSSYQPRTHPEDIRDFKRYTTRSRPMTLVSELCVAQPQFGTAGPSLNVSIGYKDCDPDSIEEMLDDTLSSQLSVWCEMHLPIWLPALPSPRSIKKARIRGLPLSASVRLLEAAQYVVAIQHASLGAARAMLRQRAFVRLVRVVEGLLARCMHGSQRDIDAARAMELLAAFPIASAYLDCGQKGKANTIEVSILASSARRIASVARHENGAQKLFEKSRDIHVGHVPPSALGIPTHEVPDLTSYEFELAILWCSTSTWDFCCCVGSDDVLQSYAVKHHPKPHQVEHLLNHMRKHPSPTASAIELGQIFVLLRAYRLAHLAESWIEMIGQAPFVLTGTREHEGTAAEYADKIGKIVKQFEERGHDCQALRRSWLETHSAPEAEAILQWLDIEDSAWSILFFGLALFYVMQHGRTSVVVFSPEYLIDMIKNGTANDPIRQFVFSYGEDRLGIAESLLGLTNNLANAPLRTLDGVVHDLVFPTMSTCGYVLESCMLSMEVHATTAKFWKTLPTRNQSWMYGMRGVVAMLKRMNDVSEEEGGVVNTSLKIATGMLDVVGIWKRATTRMRVATNISLQAPDSFDRSDVTSPNRPEHDKDTAETPATTSEGQVAGYDIGIPPLATDGESVTLDHILRDMFGGSQDWADVLPSIKQSSSSR